MIKIEHLTECLESVLATITCGIADVINGDLQSGKQWKHMSTQHLLIHLCTGKKHTTNIQSSTSLH